MDRSNQDRRPITVEVGDYGRTIQITDKYAFVGGKNNRPLLQILSDLLHIQLFPPPPESCAPYSNIGLAAVRLSISKIRILHRFEGLHQQTYLLDIDTSQKFGTGPSAQISSDSLPFSGVVLFLELHDAHRIQGSAGSNEFFAMLKEVLHHSEFRLKCKSCWDDNLYLKPQPIYLPSGSPVANWESETVCDIPPKRGRGPPVQMFVSFAFSIFMPENTCTIQCTRVIRNFNGGTSENLPIRSVLTVGKDSTDLVSVYSEGILVTTVPGKHMLAGEIDIKGLRPSQMDSTLIRNDLVLVNAILEEASKYKSHLL